MDIWTSDYFPIDSGLVPESVKTGQKTPSGKDKYKLVSHENCHASDDGL